MAKAKETNEESVIETAPVVLDEAPAPEPCSPPLSPAACAVRAVAAALRRLGPCNDVSLSKSFQREADNLDLIAKGL